MCGVVIRTTGPSRSKNASSATIEATSAPHPQSRGFSSTVTKRPVFATDARIVVASSGTSDRTSITSASIPSRASRSAASRAFGTIAPSAQIVTSLPGRSTLAEPSRSTISPSGTSPLLAYRTFGSTTITGSGSRTAAANSPIMSAGVDGTTTLRPGIAIAQLSTLCECWAPNRTPPPLAVRITSGSETCPSVM